MDYFLILILLMISVFYYLRFFKKKWRNLFDSRKPIKIEVIYKTTFYSYCEFEEFKVIWNDISKILNIEPDRLRPTDRFTEELSFNNKYYDPLDDLYDYCDIFAFKYNSDFNPKNISNIKELIFILLDIKRLAR